VAKVLYRLGSWVAAHRLPVLVAWIAIAIGVSFAVARVGGQTSDNLSLPGTDSQRATDLLAARFPPQQNGKNPIVFHVSSGTLTSSANKTAVQNSINAIRRVPHVVSAVSPYSDKGAAQLSKDKRTAFTPVLLDIGSGDLTEDEAQDVLDATRPAQKAGIEVAAGNSIGSKLSKPKTESSEVVGIVLAMIILSLTFGTFVAMGLPIVTAIVGLVVALGIVGLLANLATIPTIAPTVATMIGLGVGIDYALFMVTRHRDHLRDGLEVRESIARTVATSGSAIIFAGVTVVIALVALAVAGIPLVTALGYSAAIAVATAVLGAVTLMPALLSLLGTRINAARVPAFLRPRPKPPGTGAWAGWARFVTTRPWLAVGIALAILIPLAIPVFWLNLGQEDIGQTPTSTTERKAYDLMTAGFGIGYNGPLLIATQLGAPAKPSAKVQSQENQLQALQKQLEQEQKEGQQSQAQLQREAASLKASQAKLEAQQASLEAQAASLARQTQSLQAQEASLRSQAAALENERSGRRAERDRLRAQARSLLGQAEALARQGASIGRRLVRVEAGERRVQSAIAATTSRVRRRLLGARLTELRAEQRALEGQLASVRSSGARLRSQAESIRRQAESLHQSAPALRTQAQSLLSQASQLAAQAAGLERQKASLQAQAASLQRQAAALQAQAAALQKQQADLEQLQKTAAQQQKQAEKLKSELTAELTKAGGDDRGTDPRLVKLQDALTATSGVDVVSPPQINSAGNAAIYSVIATTAPSSTDTADLVRTLRSPVIPDATGGTDVTAYVGGSTAGNVDLASEISSKLPLVILTVLGLCSIVLLLAFRSLLVPLQAAITNLLCVGAAFGVLTATFQLGWGISLVSVQTTSDTVPIASYVPLMMFAILFGLSMDYQVFLLSQVAQHRGEGEDDRGAVASGLAASARVITAAGLIMIGVFGSFILNGDPIVKQFGVGLAVAVALAASMVLLLSPALLVLLRGATWWLPRWLGRAVPEVDIEGQGLLATLPGLAGHEAPARGHEPLAPTWPGLAPADGGGDGDG
jgi:uncharacterized membrane protein YdfJ with MMPL/SSD domain